MENSSKQFVKLGDKPIKDLSLNIFYTNYWLLEKYNSILKKFNLKFYKQYYVLKLLNESKIQPVPMNTLQDGFFDKKINFSRLIDTLHLLKLVKRIQCENDRRSVDLSITDKGKIVLKEIDQVLSKMENVESDTDLNEAQKLNSLLNNFRAQKVF